MAEETLPEPQAINPAPVAAASAYRPGAMATNKVANWVAVSARTRLRGKAETVRPEPGV